jgi:hypothetical protein
MEPNALGSREEQIRKLGLTEEQIRKFVERINAESVAGALEIIDNEILGIYEGVLNRLPGKNEIVAAILTLTVVQTIDKNKDHRDWLFRLEDLRKAILKE